MRAPRTRHECARRGILSGIIQPARRNHTLSAAQAEANGWLAAMRAGIEKIFGHWKRMLGWRRLRYTGLAKGGDLSEDWIASCACGRGELLRRRVV
ncbi:MAG: hypothetical protein ABIP20_09470 [Chthoniobacteraceae bacterium]